MMNVYEPRIRSKEIAGKTESLYGIHYGKRKRTLDLTFRLTRGEITKTTIRLLASSFRPNLQWKAFTRFKTYSCQTSQLSHETPYSQLLFIFQTDIFLLDRTKGIGKSVVDVDSRVLPSGGSRSLARGFHSSIYIGPSRA